MKNHICFAFLILLSLEPSISQGSDHIPRWQCCVLSKTFFLLDRFRQEYPQRLQQEPSETVLLMIKKTALSGLPTGEEPGSGSLIRHHIQEDFISHMSHFKISFLIVFSTNFNFLFYQMMQTEESFHQKL